MKSKLIIIICILIALLILCVGIILINNTSNTNVVPNNNDISDNNSIEHIKLSEISSHNMGVVDASSDYYSGKYYEVYRDGSVITYDLYNKSGKKNEEEYEIPMESITQIEKLLKSSVNKSADSSATDGTAWTFTYFDKTGKQVGEYRGYIYSYNEFNEILELLKK